jgi:hypothetical protein
MSNEARILFITLLSLVTYPIALGIGYAWVRAMHYPFTLRQRKMWNYYLLFISAIPVLGPLMVAMGLWLMPVNRSIAITICLLVLWIVVAFYIVHRMSKPGGRLSEERQK